MKDYLKSILTRLIRANSETEMEAILEDAATVIANGNLTDKEAINFTTQIMNMKKQLGIVKRTKHYDLAVIQNVISNVKCHSCNNGTINIENFFGLFSEDNTYMLAKNISSAQSLYNFWGNSLLDEFCNLKQNVGKIVQIAGERTYVVSAMKLYCYHRYDDKDLQRTVNAVNLYLHENPDFIPDLFEQVEERQKTKR